MRRMAGFAVLLALVSCRFSGVAFVQDDRIQILTPEDRATVTLPLEVSWTARDLPPGTTFALFVDRAPVAPGAILASLFSDDHSCARDPACPSPDALLSLGVHRTTRTTVVLESPLPEGRPSSPETHDATLILIDASGKRIGESAFAVTFTVADDG